MSRCKVMMMMVDFGPIATAAGTLRLAASASLVTGNTTPGGPEVAPEVARKGKCCVVLCTQIPTSFGQPDYLTMRYVRSLIF